MKFNRQSYGSWKFSYEDIMVRLSRVLTGLARVDMAGIKFDAVALRGTSGIWLAPLLLKAGYEVVLVRKEEEKSHGQMCEGKDETNPQRLVFVDDLICSGATLEATKEGLRNHEMRAEGKRNPTVEIVAIVLHDQMYYPEPSEEAPTYTRYHGIPLFEYRYGS